MDATINGSGEEGAQTYDQMTPEQRKEAAESSPTLKKYGFSFAAPIERSKDLYAVHTLSSEKIKGMFKLGAIPAPSIGIVNSKTSAKGTGDFGNITFVFDKSSIDPEADSRNKVYGADAWTPVYSHAGVHGDLDFNGQGDAFASAFAPEAEPGGDVSKELSEIFNMSSSVEGLINNMSTSNYVLERFAEDVGMHEYNKDEYLGLEDALDDFLAVGKDPATYKGWYPEFYKWAEDKFKKLGVGIKNVTRSGKDATPDNIVEEMFKNRPDRMRVGRLNNGLRVQAAGASEYNSIQDIIDDSDRLKHDPDHNKNAMLYESEIDTELKLLTWDIDAEVAAATGTESWSPDRYSDENINAGIASYVNSHPGPIKDATEVAEHISDRMRLTSPAREAFIDSFVKNSSDVIELVNRALTAPATYFEAKPHRSVGWDEVKVAIIPRGLSKDHELIDGLKQRGVKIEYYSFTDAGGMTGHLDSDAAKGYGFSTFAPGRHKGNTDIMSETLNGMPEGKLTPHGKVQPTGTATQQAARRASRQAAMRTYEADLAAQMDDRTQLAARDRGELERTRTGYQRQLDTQAQRAEQQLARANERADARVAKTKTWPMLLVPLTERLHTPLFFIGVTLPASGGKLRPVLRAGMLLFPVKQGLLQALHGVKRHELFRSLERCHHSRPGVLRSYNCVRAALRR